MKVINIGDEKEFIIKHAFVINNYHYQSELSRSSHTH